MILNARPEKSEELLFQGNASSVILPGAEGEFEVLDFHKPILSQLKKGFILVDNAAEIPVQGGIVKMHFQNLVALVDL